MTFFLKNDPFKSTQSKEQIKLSHCRQHHQCCLSVKMFLVRSDTGLRYAAAALYSVSSLLLIKSQIRKQERTVTGKLASEFSAAVSRSLCRLVINAHWVSDPRSDVSNMSLRIQTARQPSCIQMVCFLWLVVFWCGSIFCRSLWHNFGMLLTLFFQT